MDRRLKLHDLLCEILGSRYVYYQPPEGFKMNYPCIVYTREKIKTDYANNRPYIHQDRYSVTSIDTDPESTTPRKIADLPTCSHDRHFVSDNLHHEVFILYY